MVGGHGVAEQCEHAGTVDVLDRIWGGLHAVEEGLLAHVGGLLVPGEQFAFRHVESLPAVVAFEYGGVVLEEHLTADGAVHHGFDLGIGRPDVLQIHVVAIVVFAERLGFEIEVHGAGERVSDDQRRGCQVVHLDVGADAAFEVAVAGEHGGDGQVVGVDGFGDLGQQRAGVADAGGAAEADELVSERVEVVLQAGGLEVVGYDLGAGSERGLDPRLRL